MFKSNQPEQPNLTINKGVLPNQPTDQMIEAMIGDAICAPSGDNAQPWRFQWIDHRLSVLHCEALAKHSLNRKNHASQIALGALLEAFRLSASKYGFLIKTHLVFQTHDSYSVWAEIRFLPSNSEVDRMAAMITRRTTDRRPYQGGTIDSELWGEILAIESEFHDCKVHIQEQQTAAFLDFFFKSEELLWKNSKIVRDLGRWLRLSKHEVASSSDGMPWRSIGINAAEAWIFRLIRRFPVLPGLLWSLGFGLRIRHEGKIAIKSSAALICFTAKSLDAESLCKIGALAYRTWLLLNSRGFGVQPLSYSSTSIADLISGALSHDTTVAERELFREGARVLQENFTLQTNQIPVWVFRTGTSSTLPKENRTLRHAVSEFLLPVNINIRKLHNVC